MQGVITLRQIGHIWRQENLVGRPVGRQVDRANLQRFAKFGPVAQVSLEWSGKFGPVARVSLQRPGKFGPVAQVSLQRPGKFSPATQVGQAERASPKIHRHRRAISL